MPPAGPELGGSQPVAVPSGGLPGVPADRPAPRALTTRRGQEAAPGVLAPAALRASPRESPLSAG